MRVDPAISANANPVDAPLRCPNCNYNLTGLPENRCPECGQGFDPLALQRVMGPEICTATPWDTRPSLSGFWKTWWMALSSPRQLAAHFPARHSRKAAIAYSVICYSLSVLVFWMTSLAFMTSAGKSVAGVEPYLTLYGITLGALCCFWICEIVVALTLGVLVRPRRACRAYHFWRGLTNYASGFTLFTALLGGFVIGWVCSQSAVTPRMMRPYPFLAIAGVVLLLWTTALGQMIASRAEPGMRRNLACLSLPGIGAAIFYYLAYPASFWGVILTGKLVSAARDVWR